MKRPRLDREKLRDGIRRLGKECIFQMLDEAIDVLPSSKLETLASKYLDTRSFLETEDQPKPKGLLAKIKAFEKASLAQEYYESFDVNWRNSTEKSMGTIAWSTKFNRLMEAAASKAKTGDPKVVRKCMEILFDLLDTLDSGDPEVVFFDDEGGSWQIGVNWAEILPVWFQVLSATAEPEVYSHGVLKIITQHQNYRRAELLAIALSIATPSQRDFLAVLASMKPAKDG